MALQGNPAQARCRLHPLLPPERAAAVAAPAAVLQEGRIITTGDMGLVDKLEEEGYAVLKSV